MSTFLVTIIHTRYRDTQDLIQVTTRVSELPHPVFTQPTLITSEELKSLSVAQATAGIVIKTLWGVS